MQHDDQDRDKPKRARLRFSVSWLPGAFRRGLSPGRRGVITVALLLLAALRASCDGQPPAGGHEKDETPPDYR